MLMDPKKCYGSNLRILFVEILILFNENLLDFTVGSANNAQACSLHTTGICVVSECGQNMEVPRGRCQTISQGDMIPFLHKSYPDLVDSKNCKIHSADGKL